jgi:hypothetical protein
MKYYFTFLIVFACTLSWSQKYDYLWTFGSKTVKISTSPDFGLIQFDFREDPPVIFIDSKLKMDTSYYMYHGYVSVSMCDSVGNHQFYSSGVRFKNFLHQEMDGGPFYLATSSFNAPQQAIGLPIGGQVGRYYFIQDSTDFFINEGLPYIGALRLWYSVIDMTSNSGLGRIDPVRVHVLHNDTLTPGKITAVKHGNGRDWWILKGGYGQSGLVYKILALQDTVYLHDVQLAFVHEQLSAGQALFSPGGDKYVITMSYQLNMPGGFFVYDFDRCSGYVSVDTFKMYSGGYILGAAFSPDGRFLYISANDTLFQYDFHASDLLGSETVVAVYDPMAAPGHTNFYRSMMGPDGKIYWATPGGTKYLNVIEDPHEKGLSCNVRQALYMGAFMSSTQANYPNYRLGPLDGSPCDTLGMDNMPLAEFRVRSDSTLTVRFIDRSAYEPEHWYWTFGDGGTSTAIHPMHSYATAGTYEVCLLVSNSNGSDTYCRTITLGTVATDEIRSQAQVTVFPNPASEYLSVNIAGFHPIGASLELVNMQGQWCLASPLTSGLQTIPLPSLPSGLYIWRVVLGGAVLDYGRVVVE